MTTAETSQRLLRDCLFPVAVFLLQITWVASVCSAQSPLDIVSREFYIVRRVAQVEAVSMQVTIRRIETFGDFAAREVGIARGGSF
jgi:hypothetical protein